MLGTVAYVFMLCGRHTTKHKANLTPVHPFLDGRSVCTCSLWAQGFWQSQTVDMEEY